MTRFLKVFTVVKNLEEVKIFLKNSSFWKVRSLRPDLNGALFAQRSEAKKRERKAEKGAQIILFKYLIFAKKLEHPKWN